ncbi:uncharacterized protein P174DRAFT_459647 [Aspergillus novofumigatus IBT 16806]|uniref:Uncharacterized protein n=1 Tax=Aspergillus novofumigatus (strain IBT 16806) TaxID=1392255 RepID=A0A2I1CEY5_ASPN1|nr:uncharacterized protein P174DRAFT_459647 [Aspergillus novofumigatus IBT 16806]PKX96203.1 hypothetical protein P174DRAFT_459647 [Aspergillus novofumigatus IBT 16806]
MFLTSHSFVKSHNRRLFPAGNLGTNGNASADKAPWAVLIDKSIESGENAQQQNPALINKTTSELDKSWGVYDAVITLLQVHFCHCKDIMLQERDAIMAQLEKDLCRADELYCTLAQQGCNFSIFPSPVAFELYLDQAKETGGVFEEGSSDLNRAAESRVWRSVELGTLKDEISSSTSTDGKPGYWIRTSLFDWVGWERKDMRFV